MIPTLIIVGLVVVLGAWGVAMYNGLIRQRNLVQESWRQIDVELKRRHDLIPNLVETVKGYATHERDTLDAVIRARGAAMSGTSSPAQAAAAEGALSAALGRLIAVSEAYPDLKANANFQQLQAELTSTEDRIASARRYYNANVRELNTKVESVPTSLLASRFNIKQAEYFEIADGQREPVQVDFGNRGPAAAPSAPPAVSATPSVPAPTVTPVPPSAPAVQQPIGRDEPLSAGGQPIQFPERSSLDLPDGDPRP